MIGIKIGDEFLEVKKDTRISLRLVNPIFNEDNLSPGSGSFPFGVPSGDDSPHNSVLLGHPDVIENTEGLRKLDATLYYDGLPLKTGKLVLRGQKGNTTDANFNFGLNSLSDEIKTKKLREIIAENIVIDNSDVFKKIYIKPGSAATTPYKILVNGQEYENATLSGLATDISASTGDNRAAATYVASGANSPNEALAAPYIIIAPYNNPGDPLSPLHVNVAEDNGSAAGGYKWLVDADLDDYYAGFNTFLASYMGNTPATDKFRFPFLVNLKSQNELLAGVGNHYVNAIINTGVLQNNPNQSSTPFISYSPNSLQPFLMVRWIFDKIAEYFNWQYEGDWLDDADTQSMLLDNTVLLDVVQDFVGAAKFNFWKRSFNLADLVPDVTAVNFIRAFQDRYNLGVYINENSGRIRIIKREPIALAAASEDITSLCGKIPGGTDARVNGFRLVTDEDKIDLLSKVDEVVIGEGEKKIPVSLGTLQSDIAFVDDFGRSYSGPQVSQKQADKFGLRVFYYKGIFNNGTFTYPRASVDAEAYRDKFDPVPIPFDLRPSVYTLFWKYWLRFDERRRMIMVPVSFEYRHLNRLNWELKRRIQNNNYLIKSIDVDITMKGLSVSSVELYTMV